MKVNTRNGSVERPELVLWAQLLGLELGHIVPQQTSVGDMEGELEGVVGGRGIVVELEADAPKEQHNASGLDVGDHVEDIELVLVQTIQLHQIEDDRTDQHEEGEGGIDL